MVFLNDTADLSLTALKQVKIGQAFRRGLNGSTIGKAKRLKIHQKAGFLKRCIPGKPDPA